MVKVIRNITNASGQTVSTQEEEMTDAQYQQYLTNQAAAAAANVPTAGPPASDPATTAAPADQGKTLHTAGGLSATEPAPQATTTEGLTSSETPPATKKSKKASE